MGRLGPGRDPEIDSDPCLGAAKKRSAGAVQQRLGRCGLIELQSDTKHEVGEHRLERPGALSRPNMMAVAEP
jgi:hypothetical protein